MNDFHRLLTFCIEQGWIMAKIPAKRPHHDAVIVVHRYSPAGERIAREHRRDVPFRYRVERFEIDTYWRDCNDIPPEAFLEHFYEELQSDEALVTLLKEWCVDPSTFTGLGGLKYLRSKKPRKNYVVPPKTGTRVDWLVGRMDGRLTAACQVPARRPNHHAFVILRRPPIERPQTPEVLSQLGDISYYSAKRFEVDAQFYNSCGEVPPTAFVDHQMELCRSFEGLLSLLERWHLSVGLFQDELSANFYYDEPFFNEFFTGEVPIKINA